MVEFSNEALDHLAQIRADERFSRHLTEAMAQKLVATCLRLPAFPDIGRPGRLAGTREVFVKPFKIVYLPDPHNLTILAIWHMREDH